MKKVIFRLSYFVLIKLNNCTMTTNKTRIVEYVYTEDEILLINHTLTQLTLLFNTTTTAAIEFAARYSLIKNEQTCSLCGRYMKLYKKNTAKDKMVWRCVSVCRFSCAITYGSIFSGSHLSCTQLIKILYMWCDEYNHEKIKKELSINKNTCVAWCLKIRECIEDHIETDGNCIGGLNEQDTPIDVEIDESLFFKRKYNRGRVGNPQWVFGGIERYSGKCFFEAVENRSAGTLLSIINRKILPGSRIISDQWAAYRSLASSNTYMYASVNHSLHFVSPDDPEIHTQTIESLWSYTKRKLRCQYGTSENLIEGYFFEFVWRKRVKYTGANPFNVLLLVLRNNI